MTLLQIRVPRRHKSMMIETLGYLTCFVCKINVLKVRIGRYNGQGTRHRQGTELGKYKVRIGNSIL